MSPARGEPPDALRCDWCSELLPDDGTVHVQMGPTADDHMLFHADCCVRCNQGSLPFQAEPWVIDVPILSEAL